VVIMRVDDEAKRKIQAAITAAEKGTNGEIVVVIADRSTRWEGPRAVFSLSIALLAMFVAAVTVRALNAAWEPFIGVVAFSVAFLFASLASVTRLLLQREDVDDAVLDAAKVAFLDRGVHRTRERSGVLVFLSLLERRVQILGDAGVHAAVGDDGWRAYADRVVDAVRLDKVDDLVSVIADVGAVLARSFPKTSTDVNELPDEVVVQRAQG
jgi:putative membrane protein